MIQVQAEYNYHLRNNQNLRGWLLEHAISRFRDECSFPRRRLGIGIVANLERDVNDYRFWSGHFPGTTRPHPGFTASRETLQRLATLTEQYLA